jgi:hypothetical protein
LTDSRRPTADSHAIEDDRMTKPFGSIGVALALLFPPVVGAQAAERGLPFDSVALSGLGDFRAPGPNWRVAGSVSADRNRARHLEAGPGSGILVNLPGRAGAENLLTSWEHGDLELELEVLMPRSSNSGIYLQGRYEVQLLDSWGVRNPTSADIGVIYERWDASRPEGSRGYEGHPPRVNAARAPGLWQRFEILFRAPRFDAEGRKISNARFVRVVHNGVVIHENVEVTGPTRAAAFEDERPLGPLMLQGDHGPVAFRNIRYKSYTGERLEITGLRYRAYHGEFPDLDAATHGAPVSEGPADGISSAPAAATDRFALVFDGTLRVPVAGRWLFHLGLDWINEDPHFAGRVVGGGRLVVGGREALHHGGTTRRATGEIALQAGEHPFTLTFYKNRPWTDRYAAQLMAEGPGVERHALHSVGGTPVVVNEMISVEPGAGTEVLRGFVRHAGGTRTHAASVGDAAGIHYAYDLAGGALLYGWRGPFVETTDMWHSRGERQLALPRGSRLSFEGAPAIALLATPTDPWPDSVAAEHRFQPRGYVLDAAGRPTFTYRLAELDVEDRIRPAENGGALHRELRVRGSPAGGAVHARLAAGPAVRRERDGAYTVGDRSFYVVPDRGTPAPLVRRTAAGEELLVPLRFRGGEAVVGFTVIW